MVVRGSSCLCPVPRAWPGLVLLLFVGERGVSGQRAACAQPALHVANTRQKAAACAATSTLLAWTAYLYIFTFFYSFMHLFPFGAKGRRRIEVLGVQCVCLETLKALCNPARCREGFLSINLLPRCTQPERCCCCTATPLAKPVPKLVVMCRGETAAQLHVWAYAANSSAFGMHCGHAPVSASTPAVTALAACGTVLRTAAGPGKAGQQQLLGRTGVWFCTHVYVRLGCRLCVSPFSGVRWLNQKPPG